MSEIGVLDVPVNHWRAFGAEVILRAGICGIGVSFLLCGS
jgi:hypothetical protein